MDLTQWVPIGIHWIQITNREHFLVRSTPNLVKNQEIPGILVFSAQNGRPNLQNKFSWKYKVYKQLEHYTKNFFHTLNISFGPLEAREKS